MSIDSDLKDQLHKALHYNPETGDFIRLVCPRHPHLEGRIAGGIDTHGYRNIRINGRLYLAHRLAWLYVYGYWPATLDHIDHNTLNNRISNLREATAAQNIAHTRSYNPGRLKGTSRTKKGRWRARLGKDGREIHLGVFDTEQEAHERAMLEQKKIYGEFSCS